jgi:gamma-glutamyltranspeptidase/glutathione hydrolase
VLTNLIDLGMNLQQAIEAPRYRYVSGTRVLFEDAMTEAVIKSLIEKGHQRTSQAGASMGGGQAIMIDPASGTLMGASDPRKDGMALGY